MPLSTTRASHAERPLGSRTPPSPPPSRQASRNLSHRTHARRGYHHDHVPPRPRASQLHVAVARHLPRRGAPQCCWRCLPGSSTTASRPIERDMVHARGWCCQLEVGGGGGWFAEAACGAGRARRRTDVRASMSGLSRPGSHVSFAAWQLSKFTQKNSVSTWLVHWPALPAEKQRVLERTLIL